MTLEYTTLPEVYQLLKSSTGGRIQLEVMPYSQLKDKRPSAYANLADHLQLANRGINKTCPVNGVAPEKKNRSGVVTGNGVEQQKPKSKLPYCRILRGKLW